MLDQTLVIVSDLVRAFPRSPVGDGTPAVYHRELSDIQPAALERAVRHLIRTSTEPWLPTIGQIRLVVAEQQLALPDEQEALAQVDRRLAWARTQAGAPPDVHPLVQEALSLTGGYAALRTAENPAAARGALLRHYRALRQRAVAGAQSGLALEQAPRRAALER